MYNSIDPRERSGEVARCDVVDPDELEAGPLHRPDECLALGSTRSSTDGMGSFVGVNQSGGLTLAHGILVREAGQQRVLR